MGPFFGCLSWRLAPTACLFLALIIPNAALGSPTSTPAAAASTQPPTLDAYPLAYAAKRLSFSPDPSVDDAPSTASVSILSQLPLYRNRSLLKLSLSLLKRFQPVLFKRNCTNAVSKPSAKATWIICPAAVETVQKLREKALDGETVEIVRSDMSVLVDAEAARINAYLARRGTVEHMAATANGGLGAFFDEFQAYDDIQSWAKLLAKAYPALVQVASIGTTVLNRTMSAVIVSGSTAPFLKPRRMYIQALVHAREWITTSSALYLIHLLVTSYIAGDVRTKALMDALTFVVVPVANPDGLEFSRHRDRYWRRNRSKNADGSRGTDINRSFPAYWNLTNSTTGKVYGASTDPVRDDYRGPAPASEPETRALMAIFNEHREFIIAAIDLHSFDAAILRPYGWSTKDAPDDARSLNASLGLAQAMTLAGAPVNFTSIKSFSLYPVSGEGPSWWKQRRPNDAYFFGMELTPSQMTESEGFIVAPSSIREVGKWWAEGALWLAERAGMETSGRKIDVSEENEVNSADMAVAVAMGTEEADDGDGDDDSDV